MRSIQWPVRVYYEDTDAAGIVYYANYLKYLERARTEYLRAAGFEQDQLVTEHGVVFVVRRLSIEYRLPALFNDELVVGAEIEKLRGASITFSQYVKRQDGGLCCTASVLVACLDAKTMRPRPIPDFIVEEMQGER